MFLKGILAQDDPFLPDEKEISLDQIKEKLLKLESQQEQLREEGATLQVRIPFVRSLL